MSAKKLSKTNENKEPTAAEKMDPEKVPALTDAEILYLRKNVLA